MRIISPSSILAITLLNFAWTGFKNVLFGISEYYYILQYILLYSLQMKHKENPDIAFQKIYSCIYIYIITLPDIL